MLAAVADGDFDVSFFEDGVSHLRSDGTFPDEFVEAFFLGCTVDFAIRDVSRANSFVSLLSAFGSCMVVAMLVVFIAERLFDFGRNRAERER